MSKEKKKKDVLKEAILKQMDELTAGTNKRKIRSVSIFQGLKQKGIFKNSNDFGEKLSQMEKDGDVVCISGGIWAKA